jgi:MFS family permease
MVTVSGIIWGLGYFLVAQVGAVWQMYIYYGLLISIGMASVYVPTMSITARWFVQKRGLMTGVVQAGVSMGGFVFPPILSLLIAAYGWRDSSIVMGAVTLLLVVLAAQFIGRSPEVAERSQQGTDPGDNTGAHAVAGFSLGDAARTRQFWLSFAVLFIAFFCVDSIVVHIVPYITDLKYTANIAATVLAIMSGVSFLGKLVIGSTSDRIGNKPALAMSLALMSSSLFWLLVSDQLWQLYLFSVVFGLGYGGMAALQSPLVAWLFGLKSHGVILGLIVFGGTMGTVLGPLIAGYTFDITASYDTAFLLCALLSTAGLVLTLLLTPTEKGGD